MRFAFSPRIWLSYLSLNSIYYRVKVFDLDKVHLIYFFLLWIMLLVSGLKTL